MTALSSLTDKVRLSVPTITEDQVYMYFLYGEASSLTDMDIDDLAGLLKTGLRYTKEDCSAWLAEAFLNDPDYQEMVEGSLIQTFKDTPDLYL